MRSSGHNHYQLQSSFLFGSTVLLLSLVESTKDKGQPLHNHDKLQSEAGQPQATGPLFIFFFYVI
jgi:hypothetical protein